MTGEAVRVLAQGEVAEVVEEEMIAVEEDPAPVDGLFTRRSMVGGEGVTLYSRDGGFWCNSIEEYDRTTAARAERIEALKPGEDGGLKRKWTQTAFFGGARLQRKREAEMGQEPAPGTQAAKILAEIRRLGRDFELADLKGKCGDDVQPWTLSATLHSFAEREILEIVVKGRPGKGNVYRLRDGKPSSKRAAPPPPVVKEAPAPPRTKAPSGVAAAGESRPPKVDLCPKCKEPYRLLPIGAASLGESELRIRINTKRESKFAVSIVGSRLRLCTGCTSLAIEGAFRGQLV